VTLDEDELLAHLAGIADAETERRVTARALADPALRARLALHERLTAPADGEPAARVAEESDTFRYRAERLRARMRAVVAAPPEPQEGAVARLGEALRRLLTLTPAAVTLPGLAPALAAGEGSGDDLHRQTLVDAEGVRVEVHQLPGASPRVRVFVDAPDCGAAAVTLTFTDGAGGEDATVRVPLSVKGRGMAEVPVGAGGLPPAREGWRLVSVEFTAAA
jgi:hypothetical protein